MIKPDENGSYDFMTKEWAEKTNKSLIELGLEPFIIVGDILYENKMQEYEGRGYLLKDTNEIEEG